MSTGSGLATLTKSENPQLIKLMRSYNTNQQIKYLHLEAEVDVLLQQLQAMKIKQERPITASENN